MFDEIICRNRGKHLTETRKEKAKIYVGGQCCYQEGDGVLLTVELKDQSLEISLRPEIAREIAIKLVDRSNDGASRRKPNEPNWRKVLRNL